ncbi:MAG: rhodanese-like domain-containing protein [Alphaproteobacteria bacterium]
MGNESSYAGDLTARESWELLERDAKAVLVDVRSQAEWEFVGVPNLQDLGRSVVFVPWQIYPGMRPNPDFAAQVRAAGVPSDGPVIFLCRSGARSKAAAIAMTAQGYARCYNLAGGFEGPHDGERHRGTVDGWKAAGLPWTQG